MISEKTGRLGDRLLARVLGEETASASGTCWYVRTPCLFGTRGIFRCCNDGQGRDCWLYKKQRC